MITRRLSMVSGVTLAMATALAVGTPAHASDTTVTFAVSGGALSISAPDSASLGTGGTGGAFDAQLGTVTVTDARSALVATWTATVSAGTFRHQDDSSVTIGAGQISYWSGAATATSGTGVFTPGQLIAASAQALGTSRTAYSLAGGSGSNTASWNPTIVVDVPAAAIAGNYSGTITHSVT
jgi:hypothetical protein